MCITFSLLFSVSFGILVVDRAGAKSGNNNHNFQSSRRGDKVSPDLRGKVRRSRERGNQDTENVSVILQLTAPPSAQLAALLRRNGVRVKRLFRNFNSQAVELPAGVVDELAAFSELQTVSLDAEVKSFGHVSETTGADMVRADNGVPGSGVDGTGIGIAVLDSGMDTGHVAFLDKNGQRRIAFSKDFTGENRVDDPFGHGTHVASIAAGNGRVARSGVPRHCAECPDTQLARAQFRRDQVQALLS